MRVYLDTDQELKTARVMLVGPLEEDYEDCKQIEFYQIPQPDYNDLTNAVDEIIDDERLRGNVIDHYELFIAYPADRYYGARFHTMHIPNGSTNREIKIAAFIDKE